MKVLTVVMMLLTLSQTHQKKKNHFGSPFPSYAKETCFPEYSWAFLKQTCEKEEAGLERLCVRGGESSKGKWVGEGLVRGR